MRFVTLSTAALLMMFGVSTAQAHFLWVLGADQSKDKQVHLYFSESAAPDNPELLDKVKTAALWQVKDGKAVELKSSRGEDSIVAQPLSTDGAQSYGVTQAYGVMTRGDKPYFLNYVGRSLTLKGDEEAKPLGDSVRLPLEVVPAVKGDQLTLTVLWQGMPAADSQILVEGPGLEEKLEGTTDAKGRWTGTVPSKGLFSIRARHSVDQSGEFNGQRYDLTRYYSTLTLKTQK